MGRKKKIIIEENEILAAETESNQNTTEGESGNVSESNNTIDTSVELQPGDPASYEDDLKEIDSIIANAQPEKKRGRKSKEETVKAQIKIPGSLFVRMHNMVASHGLSAVDTLISKRNSIPAEMLSLDEKTMMELVPVAEMAMQQMKIEENPIAAFYIMFFAGITANYVSIKALIKKATKEDANFDINAISKK